MTADRWDTIQALYLDALDRPAADRASFLRAACGPDDALYREVSSLLDVDLNPLLDGRATDVVDWMPAGAGPGDVIDRYRLIERVGEGGMGIVFRAERADGMYQQEVAVKLVKPGMDTEAVLARFRAERQILAGLRHPGVARLLDGGVYQGRPYLVVEYIDGEPIADYCDRRRLPIEARLALFEQVCDAVAYAHRNLVVHRDLKPSNILVVEDALGARQVKLLDFGIARLIRGDGGSPVETRTHAGLRLLTPAYAAPEQLTGAPVTTATDVYGLGVVLYELLTGSRPVEPEGLDLLALERAVLEQAPAAPSAAASGEKAAARGHTPDRLKRRLAGDLDTIVLKALRKEPERRYVSAQGLLDDIVRHRQNLPVLARPDSLGYKLHTFVRRHRAGVGATLVGFVVVTVLLAVAFNRVTAERDRARQEAAKAEAVATFMQDIFSVADPLETSGQTITARELLDRGAERIATELADQPAVKAQLAHVIGTVYKSLGLFEDAERQLDSALALRRRLNGPEDPEAAQTLDELGLLYERLGAYHRAAEAHREAVAILRRHADDHPLALANALHSLAFLQLRLGQLAAGEQLIQESLAIKRRLFEAPHAEIAYSLNILGDIYNQQGRHEEAEAVHLEVLAMRRELFGNEHLDVATTLHNLAATLRDARRFEESEGYYREALRIRRKINPNDHLEIANTISQLGYVVGMQGRFDEAQRLHEEALEVENRRFPGDHPQKASFLIRRGHVVMEAGDPAGAAALYRAGLTMHANAAGDRHPNRMRWQLYLAAALGATGAYPEADSLVADSRARCASPDAGAPGCETLIQAASERLDALRRPGK
ncbi:MAG: serine/threonine-protein kinase [Rhodothermales bacterium]